MRVLFYHADRGWSGRSRAFAAAARGLAERGYHVCFVCRPDSGVEQRLSGAGYDIVPLEGEPGIRMGLRLPRVLLRRFIEVVFVHSEREQLAAAIAVRLAERGAIVRRVGVGEALSRRHRARFALRLAATGALLTRLDDAPDPTPPPRPYGTIEPVWGELGVDPERHDTMLPASRSTLGAPPDARLIVCICDTGTPRGAIANVLRTVALLAPRHPELRLALMGAGSDHDDVRIHAAALGITRIVTQLGERHDELSVMRAADAGWVVATGDTAAFAHLDLMALRVPVLAERDATGSHYVADGITGALLPAGDPAGMAAAIAGFLANDAKRTAMGNAARARVAREFPESAMIQAFFDAVEAARDRSRWLR